MLPRELISQIRRIEITTRRLVTDIFAGQYNSVFKGRGMEFSEVREYQPGDDIRSIDWNVTARFGHPYIKKFNEERELTVFLLIDLSGSEYFGSKEKLKSAVIAEVAALLAFSAIRNNDKVGMLIFTDQVELYIPPKKGGNHILRLIREILYYQPQRKGTRIISALEYLNEVSKRRALVFLLSDFRDKGFDRLLGVTSRKHDLVAVVFSDQREYELPAVKWVSFQDSETGQSRLLNLRLSAQRKEFTDYTQRNRQELYQLFRRQRIDYLEILAGESYLLPLVRFFRERNRRLTYA